MPTPPLPLLHNLLDQLDIPIKPTSLSSIPPSLLLLTLEKILQTRLPLISPIRRCKTPSDELSLVKCLMGVMADDELGMDLSAVDPVRVVMGTKEEMGVIIMGLVVIAKRRGITVYPNNTGSGDLSIGSLRSDETVEERDILDEEAEDYGGLGTPLAPDVTLSSPVMSEERLHDVFGGTSHRHNKTLFDGRDIRRHKRYEADSNDRSDHEEHEYLHETPIPRNGEMYTPASLAPSINKVKDAEEKRRIHLRDFMAFEKVSTWQEGSQAISSSDDNTSGHRTVLQEMMDEFGLG